MEKKTEKKPTGLKKARMSQVERDRQRFRTDGNKRRRILAYNKWLAKRQAKAISNPAARGQSFVKNEAFRAAGTVHQIRRIQMVNGKLEVIRRPSVGLAKQKLGVPTAWKMPEKWSEAR